MTTTPETAGGAGLLESLDRHFLAGCPSLSTSQLAQHRASGSCPECTEAARAAQEEAERQASEKVPGIRPISGEPARYPRSMAGYVFDGPDGTADSRCDGRGECSMDGSCPFFDSCYRAEQNAGAL